MQQAAKLIIEGQRLWEDGRLDDALATLQAATEVAPDLPDPWIDIAKLLREMGEEEQALEADRKVVELADGDSELIAEVAQARSRLKRGNSEKEKKRQEEEQSQGIFKQAMEIRDQVEKTMREANNAFNRAMGEFDRLVSEWNQITSSTPGTWQELTDPTRAGAVMQTAFDNAIGPLNRTRLGWGSGKLSAKHKREMTELWPKLVVAAANVSRANAEKVRADKDYEAANQSLQGLRK